MYVHIKYNKSNIKKIASIKKYKNKTIETLKSILKHFN